MLNLPFSGFAAGYHDFYQKSDVTCVTFKLAHFEHSWYFGFCHNGSFLMILWYIKVQNIDRIHEKSFILQICDWYGLPNIGCQM